MCMVDGSMCVWVYGCILVAVCFCYLLCVVCFCCVLLWWMNPSDEALCMYIVAYMRGCCVYVYVYVYVYMGVWMYIGCCVFLLFIVCCVFLLFIFVVC